MDKTNKSLVKESILNEKRPNGRVVLKNEEKGPFWIKKGKKRRNNRGKMAKTCK